MATQQEILEQLGQITGPLGPMVSIDERMADQADWLGGLEMSAVQSLTQVLLMEAAELDELGMDVEEIEMLSAEALARLGNVDPVAIRSAFYSLAQVPHARLRAIYGMGEWADPAVVPILASMAASASDPEIAVALAAALGNVGNGEAAQVLNDLKSKFIGNSEVEDEIALALSLLDS